MSAERIAELERCLRDHDWGSANRVLGAIARTRDAALIRQADEIVKNFDLGKIPERPSVYVLSQDEAREFLVRFVWLGPPVRVPAKGRGRPSKRMQYDEAAARRKSAYHKLVRLPEARSTAGAAKRLSAERLRRQVKRLAESLAPAKNLARAIVTYQELHPELLQCSESHVRKILQGIKRK